ncbi:protein DMR6-LIKE OXYGENASE 2 [Punica granatum]|uniref:Protein DMR6-LIKE OXYGENASE 2 n=2 Tax=Punica granatum TaxID=22663 RepID=A0A6P8CA61_PUNGR|nr:protein DMR6-LIKE OXYGENASE 2 [Punica granatum]
MSPAMAAIAENDDVFVDESQYQKGVKHLCENVISRVPSKYILPVQERPSRTVGIETATSNVNRQLTSLPLVDFAELRSLSDRPRALRLLAKACEQYGFFQLVNHGIPSNVISSMTDASSRFFEQPYEERAKYMSSDMTSPVRYGTSFNQSKDKVFCWRDFLKLTYHPMSQVLPHWPSSPADMREVAATYAQETKQLFLELMDAVLESLGLSQLPGDDSINIMEQFQEGSQLMVVNCYPQCPEPDLTLGMPPHSDYGFLTLLLQDQVQGLQILHREDWVTVKPIPGAFVVNVGDHLEIFSNGRYKSVLHRVLVNSARSRISVATLHSLPCECTIRPSSKLIDESNPRQYKDTDFASFLEYISSCEPKKKNFLESRKLST